MLYYKTFKFMAMASLFGLLCFASNLASAEGRFSFEKTKNDIFLRFDSQTGQIDKCFIEHGEMRCILQDDDRVKLEKEIADLKAKIVELEAGKDKSSLPSKQDIDQAFDMMQYFMGKFKKMTDDEEPTVAPQKL